MVRTLKAEGGSCVPRSPKVIERPTAGTTQRRSRLSQGGVTVVAAVELDVLEDIARVLGRVDLSQCGERARFTGTTADILVLTYPAQKPEFRGVLISVLPRNNNATRYVRANLAGIGITASTPKGEIIIPLDEIFRAAFGELDMKTEYKLGLSLKTTRT